MEERKMQELEMQGPKMQESRMQEPKMEAARTLRSMFEEDDGVGVIEVVLILVVLIGLVIIFKEQITKLLNNIFKEVNSQSKEVY